jgi:hypothetical protein
MSTKKHIVLGTVIALGAAYTVTASSADARTRNWFMTGRSLGGAKIGGDWYLSEMTDSSGGIYTGNVCGISKEFPSRTTLGVFESIQAKSAFISIGSKDWQSLKSRHGQTTPLTLHIKPSGRKINLTADIIGDSHIPELSADIPYADRESIYQDIEKATELDIVVDNRSVFAEGVEAANAMKAFNGCVSEINAAITKQRANDPFRR